MATTVDERKFSCVRTGGTLISHSRSNEILQYMFASFEFTLKQDLPLKEKRLRADSNSPIERTREQRKSRKEFQRKRGNISFGVDRDRTSPHAPKGEKV